MKKRLRAAAALSACVLLTACAAPVAPEESAASTLPPAQSVYTAPTGDATLDYTATCTLYLPGRDGQRLLAQYVPVTLSHGRNSAEAVVRALLSYESNAQVSDLGQGVRLQLTGQMPVEVAGGVCTVNLAASALQLDHEAYYAACLALSSTLCELDDIHYVNVLVADQAVGLDITANLPSGSMTAHPGEELPVLWEQIEARKTPLGEDPALTPLTSTATLYFPTADGMGILPETRNLSFAGESIQQMASGLITALSTGPQYSGGTADMPDVNSLLLYAPQVTELTDTGGRLVTLNFTEALEAYLAEQDVNTSCFIGAVTETLTTFLPSVAGVRVYIGDTMLTSLRHETHGILSFSGGMVRRSDFADYLMGQATLYFASGDALTSTLRAMPCDETADPRALIAKLMAGPVREEADAGLEPALPDGLTEADVLGVSMSGDTLLLNLSDRFAELIRTEAADYEQQLCYSLVNTLCEAKRLRRVRFFFGGEVMETLGGTLYWGGEFLMNPALNEGAAG